MSDTSQTLANERSMRERMLAGDFYIVKDLPTNVLGNPARVIRELGDGGAAAPRTGGRA